MENKLLFKNKRNSIIINSLVLFSIGLTNLVPPTIAAAQGDVTSINLDIKDEVTKDSSEETTTSIDDITNMTDNETSFDNESAITTEEVTEEEIENESIDNTEETKVKHSIDEIDEKVLEEDIVDSSEINTTDSQLHNDSIDDSDSSIDLNSIEENLDSNIDDTETDIERLDVEYFSLEENRDLAIKIMNEEKNMMRTSSSTSTLSHTQSFINQFTPFAQKYANQYGLYPSVMLAQAILESGWGKSSLSQPPYHQMFGIKASGSFSGDYIIVPTKEWVKDSDHPDGGYFITIDQPFRVYPSYDGAFKDQAEFLQKSRYINVKVDNAPHYTDATKALQTAGYATDPEYANKLNSIIRYYRLDELDFDKIIEENDVEYYGTVKWKNSGIYTLPKDVKDAVLYTSYKYNEIDVRIINETITQKNSYYKLKNIKTGQILGYIEKTDVLLYDKILENKKVNYYASVKSQNSGIYTKPKGTIGSKLYTSYLFNNKDVKIGQEIVTDSGIFSELKRWEDDRVIGWINKNDLKIDSAHSKNNSHYYAKVKTSNAGIHTKPEGTEGFILYTSYKYNNKDVEIIGEMTTNRGTFAQVNDPERNVIRGWILKKDLTVYDEILSEKKVSYFANVNSSNSGIYTEPHGFRGAVLYTNYRYNNKTVAAIEEKVTSEGSFVQILDINNGRKLGWINKSDLSRNSIYHQQSVDYFATVKWNNPGIYTAPNVLSNSVLYTSYLFNQKNVKASSEVTIGMNVFVKLQRVSDNGTIGWINKKGLDLYSTFNSRKKVNYVARVKNSNSGIYTLPRGMYGSVLYTSYKYNEKNVQVLEEASTSKGIFALISDISTKRVLGWIKKDEVYNKPVVYLDAGHGGSDSGASYSGIHEKTVNISVALKTKKILEENNVTVLMSRTNDSHLTLYERAADANSKNADLFVSIHHNAMPNNSTVNGMETYYYKYNPDYPSKINEEFHNDPTRVYESSILATSIHKNLVENSGFYDRGVRRQTFAVLRETKMPAALVELGYMSNPIELKKINSDLYQNIFASSIANGILEYLK